MVREKIYKSKEFFINPKQPDEIIDNEHYMGSEDSDGFWNEYYKVIIEDNGIKDEVDFYSYTEAYDYYLEEVGEEKK